MPTLRHSFNSFIWSFLVLALAGTPARACLEWLNAPEIPACPKDGTSLLPDFYPVVAVVIPFIKDQRALIAYDMIYKIIRASPDRFPLLVITGASPEVQKYILGKIPFFAGQWVKNLPREKAKQKFNSYKKLLEESFVFSTTAQSAYRNLDKVQASVDFLATKLTGTDLDALKSFDLERFFASENKSTRSLKEEELRPLIEKAIKTIETQFNSTVQENQELQFNLLEAKSEVQEGYTWQRDYFRAVPIRGRFSLRPIENYWIEQDNTSQVNGIVEALDQRCPMDFKVSQPIPTELHTVSIRMLNKDTVHQRSGVAQVAASESAAGNMMGIPGGNKTEGVFHLVGSNMPRDQARHLGGAYKDILTFPTHFLKVGHVDEVVGILEDREAKDPCNFAVALASPRRALELLTTEESKNDKFLDFLRWDEKHPFFQRKSLEIKTILHSRYSNPQVAPLCHAILSSELQSKAGRQIEDSKISDVTLSDPKTVFKLCNPQELTNSRVARMLQDPDSSLGKYNHKIQHILDQGQEKLMKNLHEKTGCKSIRVIPIPVLFYGGEVQEPDSFTEITVENTRKQFKDLSPEQKHALPISWRYQEELKGKALSLISNPVNGVPLGRSVIFPDPSNSVFRKAIIEAYASLGLTGVPTDAFDLNQLRGGLHCFTNIISGCRSESEEDPF